MTEQDPPPSLGFHPSARRVVRFGAFRMDLSDGSLWRDGQEIRLPPRALIVLQYLVERAGRIVSKQALMDAAWKEAHVSETSLTEAIGVIRQALGDDSQQPQFVQTVHRRGYRFVAPIGIDGAAPVPLAPAPEPATPPEAGPAPAWGSVPGWVIAAALLAAVALAATIVWLRPWRPRLPRVTRATITLPPDQAPAPGLSAHPVFTVSPDGKRIVYVAGSTGSYQLYVRQMDRFEATPIAGTRGGHGPFFSPDGAWVAFFQEGALKKVALDGGEPVRLAASPGGFGGTWLDDGTIVFAPEPHGGLMRVPASGGPGTPLPRPSMACGYRWPHAVGDGDTIIATRWPSSIRDAAVVALSLQRGTETVLADRAVFGRYVPTGHVVFVREGSLHAMPFQTGGSTGGARPLLSDIMTGVTGAGQFAFAPEGTMVYLPDSPERSRRVLATVDRAGRVADLPVAGRSFQNMGVCADRFATTINEKGFSDIWVGRIDRSALTRLTSDGANIEPVWTPDCTSITYASSRSGVMNVYMQRADGAGGARRVLEGRHTLAPGSWSPDARLLAHVEVGADTRSDIWILDAASGQRRPFAVTRANEGSPRISPDGRWLAYQSDESGHWEIYVRPLDGDGRVQVSTEGGSSPAWSPDGRLFYLRDRAILRVSMPHAPGSAPADPEQVFSHPDLVVFRPTAGGFLFARRTAEHLPLTKLNLVLNWFEELSAK